MSKPQSYDELFPGRFLKAGLLRGKPFTLTIKAVDTEVFGDQGNDDKGNPKPDKTQGIFTFKETDKQLACNVTNGQCMLAMFGDQVQADWVGKKITIFPTTVKMYNRETRRMEDTACIRLKGSPDIDKDFSVTVRLHKKKPFQMKMEKTGGDVTPDADKELSDDSDMPNGYDGAPPDDREPGIEG